MSGYAVAGAEDVNVGIGKLAVAAFWPARVPISLRRMGTTRKATLMCAFTI